LQTAPRLEEGATDGEQGNDSDDSYDSDDEFPPPGKEPQEAPQKRRDDARNKTRIEERDSVDRQTISKYLP
jgi:hypothetical protein